MMGHYDALGPVTRKAVEQIAAMTDGSFVKWTTKKPTVPGWYWRKYHSYEKELITVVHVIKEGSYLVVAEWGGIVEAAEGEWAGPLEPPPGK